MPSLNDPTAIEGADPSGMLAQVASLGRQLREGFAAALTVEGLPSGEGLRSIAVCGMGGSGVAGDIVRSLFADRLPLPVVVVKGYSLPEFCGRDTLVVAASFSGNTEETLAVYTEAVARGCRVVAMSGGGQLAERSRAESTAHVPLPSDAPVPRAALGYLAAAPIGVLQSMGLIPDVGEDLRGAADVLDRLSLRLGPERPVDDNPAKDLARWLDGRTPVVWGSEGLAEAPAIRWRTQLNENAKVPAFQAVLPELDHNEIEGWSAGTGHPYGLVILRHGAEHPDVERRVRATLEAIGDAGLDAREVHAEGVTPIEILFSLIVQGDFVSTYLAILRGVDPTPIPVLTGLKDRLRG